MANKRVFRFSYQVPANKGKRLLLHQIRDGDAFIELSPMLYALGYEYGGLLLNFPAENPPKITRVDKSLLTSDDILVLTTRPPLNEEARKPHVGRSYTPLEEEILNYLRRRYFDACGRDHVRLSESLARYLPKEVASRADIQFRQNIPRKKGLGQHVGASYRYYKEHEKIHWRTPDPPPRTAMYLLHTPNLWKGGPHLLAAFGMGGTEGLIWAYLLRKRYWRELGLGSPRFVMAEMRTRELPLKPTNLAFADDLQLDILLNCAFQ